MELSSKWDGLDRNTQRYIATIAAGSRQQSRFIALVEDYERNVELVGMAQNSAGASAAQFNIQLTGLQASLNRLQSAWEGLYTSINASNGFSFIIDTIAILISSLGDLGLGFTSLSTIILFTLSKIAISSAASATTFVANETAKTIAATGTTSALQAQAIAAKGALVAMAPQLVTIGALIAIVAVFTAGIYALNRVINKNKIAAREAAEALQEYTGKMGAANQEITSLESLIDEYNELVEAGEDTTEIRQQMIDQFPELAKGIDIETASQQKLNEAVEEYLRLKRQEAAEAAFGAISSREIEQIAETKDELSDLETQLDFLSVARNEARMNPLGEFGWEGKTVTGEEFLEKYAELERRADELRAKLEEPAKATIGEIQSIAADFIADEGLKGDYAQQYISSLLSNLTSADIEEGELKEGVIPFAKNVMQSYIDAIDNVMSSKNSELSDALSTALGGDTTKITEEVLQEWQNMGFDLSTALPNIYQDYLTEIANSRIRLRDLSGINFANADLTDAIVRAWVDKFEKAKDNKTLTESLKNIFSSVVASGDLFEGADIGEELRQQLTNTFASLDIENDDDILNFLADLRQAGLENTEVYSTLEATFDSLGVSMDNLVQIAGEKAYETMELLSQGVTEGLSVEEFQKLQEALKDYGYALELNGDSAYYSAEGIKINSEAMEDAKNAILSGSKAEIEATKASLEAQKAKDEVVLAAVQAEIKARGLNSETQAKETEKGVNNAGILASALQILGNTVSEVGKRAAALFGIFGAKIDTSVFTEMTGSVEEINAKLGQIDWSSVSDEALLETEQLLIDRIGETTNQISFLDAASKDIGTNLNKMADAAKNAGGSSSDAADAAEAYAEALKEQAEALEAAAEAEQKRIETEVEGIKKVLEAKKEALEEQNELLQKQIDKEKESQEILLEAYLKYLEKRQEEYQNTLDEMEKAAEEARELADKNNEELEFTNEIAQDYYQNQIDLIDEKINALNEEAEAEDRLQKLQEARDAYERAKNTKNRLVLVKGAGWVFKRDQDEISSTYDALQDAEREVEIAKLEDEKELLQEQADAWAEKAENIGKTTEELEKYNKAYEEFANLTEEQRKEALNAYIEAILKNNELNQDATDKENAFEDQSDADKEGTLAWNIAKVEELSEKTNELIDQINKSAEELIKDNRINEVVESLDNLLGEKGIEGLVDHFDTLASGIDAYLDNFLKLSQQITQNENDIESIEEALEDWDELTENLGKSQSELNKELEIFNRYNQMTIDQLSKDSAVYNNIANQVSNLADQWERVNAAQAAYEAAQERADMISKNGEGYATGGVNTYTGLASVHGTKSRPEVILNNSQAGALFKFIDGLTKTPTLLRRKNIPQNIESNNVSEDNSTNYTNCKFEVISNQDNFENLLQDVKNRSPLRKF